MHTTYVVAKQLGNGIDTRAGPHVARRLHQVAGLDLQHVAVDGPVEDLLVFVPASE